MYSRGLVINFWELWLLTTYRENASLKIYSEEPTLAMYAAARTLAWNWLENILLVLWLCPVCQSDETRWDGRTCPDFHRSALDSSGRRTVSLNIHCCSPHFFLTALLLVPPSRDKETYNTVLRHFDIRYNRSVDCYLNHPKSNEHEIKSFLKMLIFLYNIS